VTEPVTKVTGPNRSGPERRRVRRRELFLLVGPTARTMRWTALLGGAAAAVLTVVAARGELSRGVPLSLLPVRVAAVLLCLGAAFLLDDEAGATVEPAPVGLLARRGLRIVLGGLATTAAWGTAVWIASRLVGSGPLPRQLPIAGLTIEAAALLAVTLAAAAVAIRRIGHDRGGIVAGPTLLAFIMAVATFGRHWPLFLESSSDPGWDAAHLRWASILAASVLVLIVASLDPARRPMFLRRALGPHRRALAPGTAGLPAGGKS
jgi:hypothetical protein